ncbi:MAG: hypothetical protein A3A27_00210 [Candidatus Wildermuthbacteria bacterium RIFCSPLOWO2_01_FULL_47_18]|uniref:Uncharacterized protein n=2 Tax=Candidatus Wildermuthiibacteriota TaxID=1817923 RepID=A0A1G2RIU6_9BACT|nr:MAG: hypothetical protein A3J68_01280 [Candidatus Wildermuthbacteria bacterium RIFCSPHIGHO2_02_FULL_48_16]OHA72766.1 MAG: hypothetical protein A3A27_00210 [Candidatus Wildermuthbacteria bacterium RIFCSPLOWO2_01_FULL_47_18]
MNKTILIVVGVAVLVLAGIWFWSQQSSAPSQAQQPSSQEPSDNTASINADLEALDLGDVDKEFQGIDADVNSL